MSAIHHFVPVVHGGDAVGRHTLRLRQATAARGFTSNIYVDVTEDETASQTRPVVDYVRDARPDDVLVYQFATASYMAAWLTARRETLVVNYHNITPPELIAPWDGYVALGQRTAFDELAAMAPRTTLAVADSAFNEIHLQQVGFSHTAVVPPSAALEHSHLGEHPGVRGEAGGRGARWLSVGRLAPNKSVEDAISALALTRAHIDPEATLLVIGRPATAAYGEALQRFVADLGLFGAVTFGGFATDEAVASAYAQADVLVVTSEHEGFCVPVVEAMAAGLPVVAFRQGAIPEVVGDAGVVVDTKDPDALAHTIAALLADGPRRDGLAGRARARVRALDLDHAAERFVDLLCDVAGRPGGGGPR